MKVTEAMPRDGILLARISGRKNSQILFSVKDSSLGIDVSGGATTGGGLTLQKRAKREPEVLLKENDDGSYTLTNEKSELAVGCFRRELL